jgi:hypothetical protein
LPETGFRRMPQNGFAGLGVIVNKKK